MEEQWAIRENEIKGLVFVMIIVWFMGLYHLCWAQENTKVLDLDKAYRLALETQEKIQIAEIEVTKSHFLPKKAMTIMMPRMTVTGSYVRLNDSIEYEAQLGNIILPPIETFPEDQAVGNFQFLQPIYEGRFFPARKKASQAVDLSIESYAQTVQEVLFKVAQAYYEVLKAERLVQNAKETLNLAGEELRVSRVKFEAGAVTEDVVLRAELNISGARSQLIKDVNSLTLAKDVLKRLTGIEEQEISLVKPPELEEESAAYDDLLLKAFENRHDYRQASVAVNMAESDIELVKARFHPRLRASWDYYKVSDPGWLQEDDYWAAGVKLEIPLFEGGSRYYDLKEKRENLRQAKLALEDLTESIQIDLRGAVLKMEGEKALLDNSTKEAQLAQKNYEMTFAKYEYGAATFSLLSQALVYLDCAKTEFIKSSFDYEMAILNVKRATGDFAKPYIPEP